MRNLLSFLLVLFVFNVEVAAGSVNAEPFFSPEQIQQAAQNPAWFALLHYKHRVFGVKSEVTDDWFFLAENGRENPAAEMQADLHALYSQELNEAHFACKFPARRYWLMQQFQLNTEQLPQPSCVEWNKFRQAVNASSVTMVYPVAYMNNPQSMFGHTFILFNQPNQTEKSKFFTLNYAGKVAENVSTPRLVVDGLFGGYKGVFNVMQYEEKIKQYRDSESRGLWEYNINLTQAEVDQLVRHTWEIHFTHFDYYFLRTNCSYRLLGLLDVARPGQNLENKISGWVIPIDTVRVAINAGMVGNVEYQPAGMDYVRNDWRNLDDVEKSFVLQWIDLRNNAEQQSHLEKEYAQLPPEKQAYISDLLTRYVPLKSTFENKEFTLASLPASEVNSIALAAPNAPVRDDLAHQSGLVSLAAGKYGENSDFSEFTLRPAFHSLTDPGKGFVLGTQIKVLETKIRHWDLNDVLDKPGENKKISDTEIESVDVFGITALFPCDSLFQPTSWQFDLGAHRRVVAGEGSRPMLGYAKYNVGRSYTFASVLFYGLIGVTLEGGHALDKGFEIGPNAELGALKVFSSNQWKLSLEQTDWHVSEIQDRSRSVNLINTWNVGKDVAVELRAARIGVVDEWATEVGVSGNFYF